MERPHHPGPPLSAADEFCPCALPTPAEYLKAILVAVLLTAAGATSWLGLALYTHPLWLLSTGTIGWLAGHLIHRVAGRHRSLATGGISAATALFAPMAGYLLLWYVKPANAAAIHLIWQIPQALLSAALAYRITAPTTKKRH